jgi:hypothetical protein
MALPGPTVTPLADGKPPNKLTSQSAGLLKPLLAALVSIRKKDLMRASKWCASENGMHANYSLASWVRPLAFVLSGYRRWAHYLGPEAPTCVIVATQYGGNES